MTVGAFTDVFPNKFDPTKIEAWRSSNGVAELIVPPLRVTGVQSKPRRALPRPQAACGGAINGRFRPVCSR